MAKWYYYDQSGKKCGPVDAGTLKTLAKHGIITPTTKIANTNGREAIAGNVKGLEFPQDLTPINIPINIPKPPSKSVSVSIPSLIESHPVSNPVTLATPTVRLPIPATASQSIVLQNPIVNGALLNGMEPNTYFMLMHITGFLFFPAAIVMWAIAKNKDTRADIHGKHIFNWLLSLLIYTLIGSITCLIIIGFFILIAVGICSLVFSILAAVKASKGETWKYPYSITFFQTGIQQQSAVTTSFPVSNSASPPVQSVIEEITKMKKLLDIGAVTQEEFNTFKKKVLGM
jgi:uncharacterized Tic20 family protein